MIELVQSHRIGEILLQEDGYSTVFYSVRRWDQWLCKKPGTYRVTCMPEVLDVIELGGAISHYEHATCVVDDFGKLVRVPA